MSGADAAMEHAMKTWNDLTAAGIPHPPALDGWEPAEWAAYWLRDQIAALGDDESEAADEESARLHSLLSRVA